MLCASRNRCLKARAVPPLGSQCPRLHRPSSTRKFASLTGEKRKNIASHLPESVHTHSSRPWPSKISPRSRCWYADWPSSTSLTNQTTTQLDDDARAKTQERAKENVNLLLKLSEESPYTDLHSHTERTKLYEGEREFLQYHSRKYKEELSPAKVRTLTERYRQWGYFRYNYSLAERDEARRLFNEWKVDIESLYEYRRKPTSGSAADKAVAETLYSKDSSAAVRDAWLEIDYEQRKKIWPTVMLSTLCNCPDKAIMMLGALMDPAPPSYAVLDVLRVIERNLKLKQIKFARDRAAMANELLALLASVLETIPLGDFPQALLGLFAQKLPAHHAGELLSILYRRGHKLHLNTLMHFARKLATEAEYKSTVFGIIKGLAEDGVSLNSKVGSSIITVLLQCNAPSAVQSDSAEAFSPKDALQVLLQYGFKPSKIALTAMLNSLCKHGETEEAIRLSQLFAEIGIALDERTWATVFAGAKVSLDVGVLAKAFEVAKLMPVSAPSLFGNALHSCFYFADAESRNKKDNLPWSIPVFRPMLKLYAKKFKLETLQWWLPDSLSDLLQDEADDLTENQKFRDMRHRDWEFMKTVVPLAEQVFSADYGKSAKFESSSTIEGLMLRAYIRSLQNPDEIVAFYKFFKSRLEEGKSQSCLLMRNQGSIIHDTFIMVMSQHRELWEESLRVFGDMVRDTTRAKSVASPRRVIGADGAADDESVVSSADEASGVDVARRPAVHPKPSVFTFTILLSALLHQGKLSLADQALRAMQQLGIDANLATWNTLIRHHAFAQNMHTTVHLLKELESVGHKPDLHTFNAFSKLRRQDEALNLMQSILDENIRKLNEGSGDAGAADDQLALGQNSKSNTENHLSS